MSKHLRLDIDCSSSTAILGHYILPCRIGRGGYIDSTNGCEGDEKTPLGHYNLRWGLYRADRLSPPPRNSLSPLTWRPLQPNDGWCDDVNSTAYNRFIKLPFSASHEALWREDGAYDIILVVSHNDSPPKPGMGSAVFIHIAQPDDRKTLGCIGFSPDDMIRLLPKLHCGMAVNIYA
ncbi:L,D-transpeptidase-like protein [Litorimonas taeanensis]|uniref:L,D-transpeptidase-like protein n=1 Tax=Litorimonas taeanensis TaxID=568099 RepID=A0A420WEP8_9PROT|nr:L,D-transpeptidase family protein [Litorimonas taeanensis]RKQ69453.1 L,D-transpeptidase-like protein [Litorimonas taeanensis]